MPSSSDTEDDQDLISVNVSGRYGEKASSGSAAVSQYWG